MISPVSSVFVTPINEHQQQRQGDAASPETACKSGQGTSCRFELVLCQAGYTPEGTRIIDPASVTLLLLALLALSQHYAWRRPQLLAVNGEHLEEDMSHIEPWWEYSSTFHAVEVRLH
jgi:hypothetical protein